MGNKGQSIYLLSVEQQIHFHQIAFPIIGHFIIQGSIALGAGFQCIKKVINDLTQRHLIVQLHQVLIQILHIFEFAPPLLAHRHNIAHIIRRRDDGHLGIRFLGKGNGTRIGIVVGVIHPHHCTIGLGDLINNRRQSGHQIQVKFPLQPLLDDLHVEHSQKAAAETKAQGRRRFRFKGQRSIVKLELFQRIPQIRIFGTVLSINAAIHHSLGRAITGQRLRSRAVGLCDGITHPGVLHIFDGSGEIAHFSGGQGLTGPHAHGQQITTFQHFIFSAGGHHLHLHTGGECTLHDPEIDNDAPVGVILAVKDQGPQRRLGIPLGSRHILHNILQHRRNVQSHLGRDLRCIQRRNADDILDLPFDPLRISGRQIDFIQHRQDLQIVFQRQIGIGQGLGFDALGSIHHQNSSFTGG